MLGTSVAGAATPQKVIVGGMYTDHADFEQFARRASQSGATHVRVSDSLPWSRWQYDDPADPYPSWVISFPGLLKIAIPAALRSYLPSEHSERVLEILEARSQVLRRLGLKAAFSCYDPSMLPEAVFRDHPLWRGARVDHPARARVPRWAPSIDNPEVLALYKEAIGILLRRCPEIEVLSITTNDSGAGLDWSTGTYAGQLGNTRYRYRPMETRLREFFATIQSAAIEAGGSLDVDIRLTRERDAQRIATKLTAGMAIENLEGPGATPFKTAAGFEEGYFSPYHPVAGIPQPMRVLTGLSAAARSGAPRLVLNFGDRLHRDLYFDLYDRFRAEGQKPHTLLEQLAFLRALAVARTGERNADNLLQIWIKVHESTPHLDLLFRGGSLMDIGAVHQRWLTRPFVPFPSELTPEEKSHYRRFIFQARTETEAESLANTQGEEWGTWTTRRLMQKITSPLRGLNRSSANLARKLGDDEQARRFEIFNCLVTTVYNAISYQAQLVRAHRKPLLPDDPAWEAQIRIGWDHQLMMETARNEIDNIAELIELLGPRPGLFLNLAPSNNEEDIRLLPPDLITQLRRKLEIMNAHWEDYERLFINADL